MIERLHNSFAYRFNKISRSLQSSFVIHLNGQEFKVPLLGVLGEANISLKHNWLAKLIISLQLPENTDFIDIGANVGQTLLTFKSVCKSAYWGFELNPVCNFYLEELIKVNRFDRVSIVPVGLAAENSIVKLFIKHSHDTGATIVDGFRLGGYYQSTDIKYVPVFRFDDLEVGINKISLIKIDVEGAESNVIKGMLGAIQKHQPIIVCEILDYPSEESRELAQDNADELMSNLAGLGYSVHLIIHTEDKLEYRRIEKLVLKEFAANSYDLNDYLFLPAQYQGVVPAKSLL